jgi:hypothetical protein
MPESEITRLLHQIAQEYQASKQGLEGLTSGSARHDFMSKKAENIGKCHEELVKIVGPEQAIAIVANTIWSPGDQGSTR